ncbi:MAG: cyclase family protein [Saccharofermentanales bacterium]
MIKGRIVDLSHVLYPGKEEYYLNLKTNKTSDLYPQYKVDDDVWYILQDVEMSSHCGTHVEFPYHHNRNGMDAAKFPLDRLIGDCVLLKFRDKKMGDAVTLDELKVFDDKIREGDMVMFDFDCAKFYRTGKSHDRPIINNDAIRWLIFEKRISLIGSDASGIEIKGAANQPNHQILMDNEIPIIEFAANLDLLRKERFTLFVLVPAIEGLDSFTVRLIAIEDE